MQKNTLVVFVGKPGVGKTTLIKRVFPDKKLIDVLPYVYAYKVNGHVPEERTLDGYKDMYKDLLKMSEPLVILELGSNHPEFNVQQLSNLQKDFQIKIYICTAEIDTLRQRVIGRNRGDDMEAMELRLQRKFPQEHIKKLEKTDLEYDVLDMEKPLSITEQLIKKQC
ncbi:AAA family ATPase [Patescibacteria group bacterium]|nr:AAA family ATPase [Patescibacteria group bacterium]MBU1890098.1 AAA family ATPase [Patescibacteria group bacterium]